MHNVKRCHPNPISHTNEKPFQSAANLSLYQNCSLRKSTFKIALSKKKHFQNCFLRIAQSLKIASSKKTFSKNTFSKLPP